MILSSLLRRRRWGHLAPLFNQRFTLSTLPKSKEEGATPSSSATTKRLLDWLDPGEDSGYRGYFVSGRKKQDLEALVNTFTAPALARALRDREEILAECASLIEDKDNPKSLKELHDLLTPFSILPSTRSYDGKKPLGLERPPESGELDTAAVLSNPHEFILPDYRKGGLLHPDVLRRLSKRLNRLPREISTRARRRASVVLPLCHIKGEARVLFTRRSNEVNRHKGEVCFPGGMVDEDDPNIVATALRELHEEVGINPDLVQTLGILRCDWSEVTNITRVAVTPIVGFIKQDFESLELHPNPGEVVESFTISINALLDKESWEIREYSPPVFREKGAPKEHVVWGLTGYILHRFVKLLPSVVFGNQIATREMSF